MDRFRNNTSVNRLLHTLIPFLIMTAFQRGLYLLFSGLGFEGTGAELCAFLPASMIAVLLFRLRTYTVDEDGNYEPVEPLVPAEPVVCVLRLLAAFAALIGWMFAVAILVNAAGDAGEVVASASFSILGLISLLIIHPIVEEWIFRGMFYGELRLMSPLFGILAQGVMFAIVHRTTGEMIYALGAGLILGILEEQTGRLWCCIAAHILINLRSAVCLTALADRPEVCLRIDVALIVLGCVAFLALLIRNGRAAEKAKEEQEPLDEQSEAPEDSSKEDS